MHKKSLFKFVTALIMALSVGMSSMTVFAADPIKQASKPTSNLTIHVLQQIDEKEEGMDGTGLPGQVIPDYGNTTADKRDGQNTFALPGVTVTIQKVTYDDDDITNYTTTGEPIVKVSGADGLATFTNVPNGRYFVKYENLPQNVRTQIKDHFVDLPARNEDGTGWNYDVHVYPKNEYVYGSVVLTKKLGDDHETRLAGTKFRLYVKKAGAADPKLNSSYEKEFVNLRGESPEYVTNARGQIAVSELPDGAYAFIETAVPEGIAIDTTPIPFTVTQSGSVVTGPDGDYVNDQGIHYSVGIENWEIPEVHKGVKSVENQHSGYDIDEISTFVVSPVVPEDIWRYTKFVVKDDVNGLDERLKFAGIDTLNVVVSPTNLDTTKFEWNKLSSYTTLRKDTDYKASYDAASETWTVTFIDAASSFLAGQTNLHDLYDKETPLFVYIVFGCEFDTTEYPASEIMGDAIYNQAELDWNNGFYAEDQVLKTETPEIHTGGVVAYKYTNGSTTVPLAGAQFKLCASEDDAINGVYLKDVNGEDLLATSGADGVFRFDGVAYGEDGVANDTANTTYWLVEVYAPEGYLLLGHPVSFNVDKDSDLIVGALPALQLENVPKAPLPTTGGIGVLPFMIGGGVCVLGAAAVAAFLLIAKKKEQEGAR